MAMDGSDAESLCNLILRVWENAIYEEEYIRTNKYTRPKGYFVSDFNDALSNLFDDTSIIEETESIESNQ